MKLILIFVSLMIPIICSAETPRELVERHAIAIDSGDVGALIRMFSRRDLQEVKSLIIQNVESQEGFFQQRELRALGVSSVGEAKALDIYDMFENAFKAVMMQASETGIDLRSRTEFISDPVEEGQYLHFVVGRSMPGLDNDKKLRFYETVTVIKNGTEPYLKLPFEIDMQKIRMHILLKNREQSPLRSNSTADNSDILQLENERDRAVISTGGLNTASVSDGDSASTFELNATSEEEKELVALLNNHRNAIYSIYFRALRSNQNIEGDYRATLIIGPEGKAIECAIEVEGVYDQNLVERLCARLSLIAYPRSARKQNTRFVNTFRFSPN